MGQSEKCSLYKPKDLNLNCRTPLKPGLENHVYTLSVSKEYGQQRKENIRKSVGQLACQT